MSHKAVVISAFPGCGKTWCVNNEEFKKKYKMLDSDSSLFSHINTVEGKREPNPLFPDNYIEHIKAHLDDCDIIFVSTHDIVRNALDENDIFYVLVYPDDTPENKEEFEWRYTNRGNRSEFIKLLTSNWEKWIGDMKIEVWPVHYVLGTPSSPQLFLGEVLDDIYELNKNQ